ncbi:MAG: hypothetical protein NTX50_21700 [Candidatus Sumerlaeota bacterium]|nr:hypothetical protein [Candidatus Sumerlaeota bacterium]
MVKEVEAAYPAPRMFNTRLPAYGLYCRHAKGLTFTNVRFSNLAAEERPMLVCDDVRDIVIDGMQAKEATGDEPLLRFMNVRNAKIARCVAPPQTRLFLKLGGSATEGIVLAGNEIKEGAQIVEAADGAAKSAVRIEK